MRSDVRSPPMDFYLDWPQAFHRPPGFYPEEYLRHLTQFWTIFIQSVLRCPPIFYPVKVRRLGGGYFWYLLGASRIVVIDGSFELLGEC